MSKQPRVLLIALGGTISAAPDEVGRSFPTRVAADLLSSVPDAASIAGVTAADVKQVPSRAVTRTMGITSRFCSPVLECTAMKGSSSRAGG